MKNPPHPGLSVRRTTLSRLINGQADVSLDMAIRLFKAFGATPDVWIRMQAAYNLAQARLREKKINMKLYQPQPTA